MRPPPFRQHSRCMQHTARPHAVPSRFRTTLPAMHAKVMIMHHVVAGQSHCVLQYSGHMDSWRNAHLHVYGCMCLHSHDHAIACMHACQYPQYRILADTSMPCFRQKQRVSSICVCCPCDFALHGGVHACTTPHAV